MKNRKNYIYYYIIALKNAISKLLKKNTQKKNKKALPYSTIFFQKSHIIYYMNLMMDIFMFVVCCFALADYLQIKIIGFIPILWYKILLSLADIVTRVLVFCIFMYFYTLRVLLSNHKTHSLGIKIINYIFFVYDYRSLLIGGCLIILISLNCINWTIWYNNNMFLITLITLELINLFK